MLTEKPRYTAEETNWGFGLGCAFGGKHYNGMYKTSKGLQLGGNFKVILDTNA